MRKGEGAFAHAERKRWKTPRERERESKRERVKEPVQRKQPCRGANDHNEKHSNR